MNEVRCLQQNIITAYANYRGQNSHTPIVESKQLWSRNLRIGGAEPLFWGHRGHPSQTARSLKLPVCAKLEAT